MKPKSNMRVPVVKHRSSILLMIAAVLVSTLLSRAQFAQAQTEIAGMGDLSPDMRSKLTQPCTLDLRDATLLEALFTIRDVAGLNVVVGNEVTGTVNASFADTPVYDILDSLLITRGYGYRVVGNSLAIVPLAELGDQLPMFQTEVIGLVHTTPGDLLPSVESLLSPEGRAHAVASSNSIVVVDYDAKIKTIVAHVKRLETAAAHYRLTQVSTEETPIGSVEIGQGDGLLVQVFQPQFVSAAILAEAVTTLLTEDGQVAAVELEDKLVVTDTADNLKRIASALEQLDLPRPQVRIWAVIYDCSIEDVERCGCNWSGGLNGTSLNASGDPNQLLSLNTVTAPVTTGANSLLTLTSVNSQSNFNTIIQALNSSDDSRLLADPNVVVMNHEPAEIKIVTEVPYQQLTQGLEGGTIGTTEFREAGVTLSVTPHIAQDDTISLIVNPQFSLLTGFSEPDNAPIIDRRETKTTVRVTNNQTIVLGGLRQRTRIVNRTEVPGICNLPYLGKLFRYDSASVRESELLVFITPQIVYHDCIGRAREECMKTFLHDEIDRAPTSPVPFGIDVLRCETEARNAKNNKKLGHKLKRLRPGFGQQKSSTPTYCRGNCHTEVMPIEMGPVYTTPQ